jgi:membrane protein required for colicin V production
VIFLIFVVLMMGTMSFVDAIIFLAIIAGAVIGYMRGIIKQISSIAALVLGILVCNIFGGWAAEVLRVVVPSSAKWPAADVTTAAFAEILFFLLVYLSVAVVAMFVKSVVKKLKLGLIDNFGGAALSVLKYLFAVSIILNVWYIISPHSCTFTTRHAFGNVPFAFTLDVAPCVLGSKSLPSDSLKIVPPDSVSTSE